MAKVGIEWGERKLIVNIHFEGVTTIKPVNCTCLFSISLEPRIEAYKTIRRHYWFALVSYIIMKHIFWLQLRC